MVRYSAGVDLSCANARAQWLKQPEAAYADLEPGDWVVHVDHGIGRFNGLVQRSVDGIEREYLSVEYAEGDQLFVPVYQADRLTRYIGPDAHPPTPTRLGSPEWRTTKVTRQGSRRGSSTRSVRSVCPS